MTDPVLLSKDYILVIDTSRESFDFSKKLVAYCTGYGCEGDADTNYVDMFYDEMNLSEMVIEQNPFYEYIVDREDESGDLSPCCVLLNKKYALDESGNIAEVNEDNFHQYVEPAPFSVGIFFSQNPTDQQIALLKKRACAFFEKIWKAENVKIEGMRLIVHTKYGEEILLD